MQRSIIRAVAWIEMLIGATTIAGLAAVSVISVQHKPLNVFTLVLLSAGLSFIIGVGLYRREEWARVLIVFFSGYIILTKALLFAGLLHFNGEIVMLVPADLKNLISCAYHCFIIVVFTRGAVKKECR